MTPGQLKRLADLENRLIDVALSDADPDNWTANGTILADMTSEQRGDAAWCRKTAVQTVALLIRVQQLRSPQLDGNNPNPERSEENEIRAAEAKANAILDRVLEKHGKTKA